MKMPFMYSHPAIHSALAVLAAKLHQGIALAACSPELDLAAGVPLDIQLAPAGRFRARDGRPQNLPDGWLMTAQIAARIIERATAQAGDLVIDYEHQTLNSQDNGKPAPAAGWFRRMEWREGQGLYALGVQWTATARAAIAAGEYRYISPVFQYDTSTGEVLSVEMAALTNYPALPGLGDLQARAALKFIHLEEKSTMIPEHCALLGLSPEATQEQITSALVALKAKADSVTTKDSEIAALKAAGPDLSKHVPLDTFEAIKTENAALKTAKLKAEVDDLVDAGLSEGKLLPAQEAWARELGTKDIEALKGYLDKTPAIAALKGTQTTQTKGESQSDKPAALSETELAVCKQLGLDPAEYRKTLEAR
jgi:phage I-like protein